MTERIELTGAEVLVRTIAGAGISRFFGIVGGNLTGIFRAIHERDDLAYIGTRHEAAAAFMAAGHYNASGEVAVALGEMGPGTLNLVSGLGVAHNNHLPVLVITSTWPDSKVDPLVGTMMEVDGLSATAAVTKWNARAHDPRRLPSLVRWALREALTGSPGPVHLEIPGDVLRATAEFEVAELNAPRHTYLPSGRQHADPRLVRQVADAAATAERVLLLAGGGVVNSEATEEFRRLTTAVGAVATATQMSIGVVSTAGSEFIGHAGALGGEPVLRAMREADLVIAAGCKFGSWTRGHGVSLVPGWPAQQLVHIDLDPVAIGRSQPAGIGLVGDAKAVLSQILEALPPGADRRDDRWVRSLVALQRERERELATLADSPGLHPAAIGRAIGAALPADSLVVYDGGHTSFWSNDLTPATEPRTRFNDSGMAQLGFGGPFAHAIKAWSPGRTVVNITGDGSFGFMVQELDTARRYGLPVINVIHNNALWGVIGRTQRAAGFELGLDLSGTDYAAIARGFGCHGETVTDRDEIGPAFRRALASGLPAVIDVRTIWAEHPTIAAFGATLA
ncbi:thiamine pyrophosphate-binding protein [Okibacterium endophyticum]